MKKFNVPLLAALIFIALACFSSNYTFENNTRIKLEADSNCNPLVNICWVAQKGTGISFYLPEKVQYLKTFPVQVTLDGIGNTNIKKITITFQMSAMDMGQNQFVLKQQQDKVYIGDAILPVCVTGRMDWTAKVTVSTRHEMYQGVFRFSVVK